jgi:hypothetical protein
MWMLFLVRYVPYGALADVSFVIFSFNTVVLIPMIRSSHTLADEPSRTNLFWEMEGRLGKGKEQGGRSGNGLVLLDEWALLYLKFH